MGSKPSKPAQEKQKEKTSTSSTSKSTEGNILFSNRGYSFGHSAFSPLESEALLVTGCIFDVNGYHVKDDILFLRTQKSSSKMFG